MYIDHLETHLYRVLFQVYYLSSCLFFIFICRYPRHYPIVDCRLLFHALWLAFCLKAFFWGRENFNFNMTLFLWCISQSFPSWLLLSVPYLRSNYNLLSWIFSNVIVGKFYCITPVFPDYINKNLGVCPLLYTCNLFIWIICVQYTHFYMEEEQKKENRK